MTLRVSGKNIAIGEALRGHVHGRIDGLVAKYRAGSASGHVTIEPEGSGFRADCTLFLKAGVTLQVEALAQDPYGSFDKAAERIERRLRDHRKRVQGRHGEGTHLDGIAADEAEAAALPPIEELLSDDGADAPGESFPAVVAEPAGGFSEMTVAAAVRTLDEGGCPVVVFRYAENSRINIVYRRSDGNIGWIDPLGTASARGA